MNNKKCQLCGHYRKDGYCKELELYPCYPEKGCDYFSKKNKLKIWITTYWTTEIEPVVTPFDNQEAAESCAKYYKRQGYKVCIDECDIFHEFTVHLMIKGG